jgi:catechol 2,3-dioxygenase-like lactoylglutathione lyase family enzyme
MRTVLSHLGLEVKYLDRARLFYEDRLGLSAVRETETEVGFPVGNAELVLRRPTGVPRGGLHVHYAFSTPKNSFESWRDRLADLDPEEFEFGSYRSLYVDDPDDHCVEVGNNAEQTEQTEQAEKAEGDEPGVHPPLTGVFEIVLEVEDLDAAVAFYQDLGFEPYDHGETRRRVRLAGPFDLELWEPQLGLADARGGVHVDLGLGVENPEAAVDRVRGRVGEPTSVDTPRGAGLRVRDPDGHVLTFVETGAEERHEA